VPYTATTTYVSAATRRQYFSASAYIFADCSSRLYAFVHISAIVLSGFSGRRRANID